MKDDVSDVAAVSLLFRLQAKAVSLHPPTHPDTHRGTKNHLHTDFHAYTRAEPLNHRTTKHGNAIQLGFLVSSFTECVVVDDAKLRLIV